jgi:hypothetical protein
MEQLELVQVQVQVQRQELELLQGLVWLGAFSALWLARATLARPKAPATALRAKGGVARFVATAVQPHAIVLATATAGFGRCFWPVQAADPETGVIRP